MSYAGLYRLSAEGFGHAVAIDLPRFQAGRHFGRSHFDQRHIFFAHAVLVKQLLNQDVVRGLFIRNGNDLAFQLRRRGNIVACDDHVAITVPQKG